MNLSEVIKDFERFMNQFWKYNQAQMWTMLPGVVNKWNYPSSGQNTVHAVPGMVGYRRQKDGSWMAEPMPEHQDVPVKFVGGGGFHFTHPIAQGDEGMLLYSSRCIDGFWKNGGSPPAEQPDYAIPTEAGVRMHDLSDACFIPATLSDKKKLQNISKTTAQLRSTDGTAYLEMLEMGKGFNFIIPGQHMRFTQNGDLIVSGNVYAGS